MNFLTPLFTLSLLFFMVSCDDASSDRSLPKIKLLNASLSDTVAPNIRLNGEENLTLLKGAVYIEKKASAKDDVDGYVPVKIKGKVNTQKVGRYCVEYEAKDRRGNSVRCVRNVHVIGKFPSLIRLNGKAEIWVGQNKSYLEVGITETSDVEGELTLDIQNNVNTQALGDYTVVYVAKDARTSTVLKRVVHIVDDTPPVLKLNGDSFVRIAHESYYKERGATAVDGVDGKVVVSITGKVDNRKIGYYNIVYHAKDKAGNKAKIARRVEVVDIVSPTITLLGEKKMVLRVGDVYHEARATAVDKVDGEIEVFRTGEVDTSKVGHYLFKYTAEDKARNKSVITREIEIVPLPKSVLPMINETNSTLL